MCLCFADHKTAGGLDSVFCRQAGFYLPVLQIHTNQAARLQSGMNMNTSIMCPGRSLAPVLHDNTLACKVLSKHRLLGLFKLI